MGGLVESTYKLLKKMYDEKKLTELVYKELPAIGLFEKQEMGGESLQVPLIYSNVNNRSADFATAISGNDYRRSLQWSITAYDNFNYAFVGHKVMLAAKDGSLKGKMAYAQALQHSIDGAIKAMKIDIGATMYKDGRGIIGEVDSINAGVITFKSIQTCMELEQGIRITAYTDGTLGTPRSTIVVTSVDRQLGKITFSGNASTWAPNDFVTIAGDANAKFKGFSAWLPYGAGRDAALAQPFFGVQRSQDATRLGGVTFDATGKSIENALILAEARLRTISGVSPDLIIMSCSDLAALKLELTERFIVGNEPGKAASISYPTVEINTFGSRIKIVEDPFCPNGVAFMLRRDSWRIGHMGKDIINTWNEDGLDAIRAVASNGIEVRFYSYMQPFCMAPAENCVIYNLGQ